MADVSFICKRTVPSTKPAQPGKFRNLSVLDRVMERNHLRIVLYYRRMSGEVTEKLKESLSETLTAFPAVVGRLLRSPEGQWKIKCNDAGMRVVEAKVKGTVDEWLLNVDGEKELKLLHWEEMFHKPYFWSTFYVQITEFEGGGVAIGLSCAHMISDPICAAMIIKAWADMTLGGKMISPPLFHPLPPRRPANINPDHQPHLHLINHYKSSLENSTLVSITKQKTITFRFDEEMVRSCIAMLGTSLTPFEALSALFWTRVSKVKGTKGSLIDMSLCLDMRTGLGLDKGYFGNCMVYNKVEGDELHGKDELFKAVFAIKQVMSEMDDYDRVMDLIEWLETENCRNPPWMNGNHLVCANLENVDLYSAIFEDNESPLRVSYYVDPSVGPGQVLIFPSPRGEGALSRVVMVRLPEGEAEKLLGDSFIQKFAPTILMGLNKKHD